MIIGNDQKRAITLAVWAKSTNRFYILVELKTNKVIEKHSGMKGFVAGRIKVGETEFDAMMRESWEETGVKLPNQIVIVQELHFCEHTYPVTSGFVIIEDEFEGKPIDSDVRFEGWMSEEELRSLSFERREIRCEVHAVLDAVMPVIRSRYI